ncbi:MAG: DNA-binding NarL/FixJ family response regulator [Methylophagaceae bacterium]|jgi:DNA-binding NarL/FixJ family response regulator
MAVIGTSLKGLCMINIVVVSNNQSKALGSLSKQSDMSVVKVLPTSLEGIVEQIGDKHPDIMIIADSTETDNQDLLCHFLAKHYQGARHLVLTGASPNYEMLENSGFRARGYITPDQHSFIAKAVRVVFDGEAWLPRKLVTELLDRHAASFLSENATI